MKIILGSRSKDRQRILKEMGYDFDVMVADVDEKTFRSDDPEQLTLTLANAKADALLHNIHEPAVLITADTVVWCDGRILEKPENSDKVREFFALYPTHPATVFTAVVVVDTVTKQRRQGVEKATVWFDGVPNTLLEALITSGAIFAWAGGFAVAEPVFKPYIKKIDGPIDAGAGLPILRTKSLITEVQDGI